MPGGDSQKNLVIPAHLPSPISRQGPVSLLPGPSPSSRGRHCHGDQLWLCMRTVWRL